MNDQAPTPETDALKHHLATRRDYTLCDAAVWTNHARRLERERDEARAKVARLADWKAQQMQVEASWDAQSVADELGLPLGVSIRPEILPRIKALKAEVARLREALERIAKGGWQSHGRRIARNTLAAVRGETTKEEAK